MSSNWLFFKKRRQVILKNCYNIMSLFKLKTTFPCSIISIIMTLLFQSFFFITYGYLLGYIVGDPNG